MENVNQNEYREDLLNWCNNIYLNWENMKPKFTKLFDTRSLNEWEETCRKLKNKLKTNVEVSMEDYHEATSLYEQWETLLTESNCNLDNVESEERNVEAVSLISDDEIKEQRVENDKVDALNEERIELIKMVLNLEIPIDQIKMSLLK
jgi:predicted MPP superfamily phosphohydrolase